MKEKLGIFICTVIIAALVGVGLVAAGLHYNVLPAPYQNNFDEGDSIKVAQVIEQLESPILYSIKDVQDLQDLMVDQRTTDEVFMSLPYDVLQSVTSVLLKNGEIVTKKSIVNEYRANDRIYNNLPVSTDSTCVISSTDPDLGATDLGSRSEDKIISSSLKKRTDTVNGKPVTVITKTEESYE